jgi:hypothetical protein
LRAALQPTGSDTIIAGVVSVVTQFALGEPGMEHYLIGSFNSNGIGTIEVQGMRLGGQGAMTVLLEDGLLCSFEGTTGRVLCISVAGAESLDLANALQFVVDEIRKGDRAFTA